MSEIRLYIEGDKRLRPGFSRFFESLVQRARARGVGWDIKLCGSRTDTFKDFQTALRSYADFCPVLLVDAEGTVALKPLEHLRNTDGWTEPLARDDQCHLMVQTMEAWLVADPEAMIRYYGQALNSRALPARSNIEEVEKTELMAAMAQAIRPTSKPKYEKTVHGPAILHRLNEQAVRRRCPHCDRFFQCLETKIDELARHA